MLEAADRQVAMCWTLEVPWKFKGEAKIHGGVNAVTPPSYAQVICVEIKPSI